MHTRGNDTLVLDLSGRPISTVGWKRVSKMLYEGTVDVLVEDPQGRRLRAAEFDFGMPRVVRCRAFVNRRRRGSISCSRRNVYVRDKGLCQYCGVWLDLSEFTLDHVVPRSLGGKTTWTNTVVACPDCNQKKDHKPLEKTGMRLLHKPVEPKATETDHFFKLRINKLRPEWKPWAPWLTEMQSWKKAQDESWLYWNVELDK